MSNACDNCGLCTGNEFIADESGASPYVIRSIILEEEREKVQEIINICPVNALSLAKLKKKSVEQCRKEINEMIVDFSLAMPLESTFCYDKKYANYSLTQSVDEEWEYNYNSKEEAKKAGCKCVERNMLAERTNCIRQIINNYSIEKLAPYLAYKECSGNFYYESIQKAEQILKKAFECVMEAAEGYPFLEKYTKIDPQIADHEKLSWSKRTIDDISVRAGVICSHIYRNGGDRFWSYIDVMEGYKEIQTLFGTRDKTKYAFYGLYKAANEIRKDIDAAVESNFKKEIQDYVYTEIKNIVTSLEELLKNKMQEKMNSLMEDVESYIREGSSYESEYFRKHNTIPQNENNDQAKKICENLKEFWQQYSLEMGKSIRIVNKFTKKEIVLAKIPDSDRDVEFQNLLYYNEYVILEKYYSDIDRCDFLRVNLLNGKLEIMLKDVNVDNTSYHICYNDERFAWWWSAHELYMWDAKAKKTTSVMTSYTYFCKCIGSSEKCAYIRQDDYIYRYTYNTGELESTEFNASSMIRNHELFYVLAYENRGLYHETKGLVRVLPYPVPSNLNANDDYIVWIQNGSDYYDREIYILNRKNSECKKILSFSTKGYLYSKIYFWIREDVVQIILMDYASYILPSDLCETIHKWTISFDGKVKSYSKEKLTESIQQIMYHYQEQYNHYSSLPDIFF